MKKKYAAVFFGIFAFVLFNFTSCYDAVFQAIRTEVELGEISVSGFINGIVRFNPQGSSKQYLLVANGTISLKDASYGSSGGWFELSGLGLPDKVSYSYYDASFSGEHIFKLAADKEWIYALSYVPYYDEDNSRIIPKDFYLYACKPVINGNGALDFISNGGWQRVAAVNKVISAYTTVLGNSGTAYYNMNASIQLFCTNAPDPAHRKAFIRVGGGSPYVYNNANNVMWSVFDLNGFNEPGVLNCGSESGLSVSTDPKYKNVMVGKDVLGAVWFGDKNTTDEESLENYLFLNYETPITNESAVAHPKPSYVYYGQGEYLWKFSRNDYNAEYTTGIPYYGTGKRTYEKCEYSNIKAYIAGYSYAEVTTVTDENGTEVKSTSYKSIGKPSSLNWIYENTDSSICSLGVTKSSLLIGTGTYRSSGDGIFHLSLDANGAPTSSASNNTFLTNAADVMCEPYIVRSLLVVDPDKKEEEGIIYSSMDYIYTESTAGTTIENRGLWSYYPTTLEWNRE